MFDQLIVRNRRTAVGIVLVLWFVGVFVAFPGQFIGLVLLDLFTKFKDPEGLFLIVVMVHASALLVGPLLVVGRIPRWIIKLGGDAVAAPQPEDMAIVSTLDALAVATGRPAPLLMILRDERPNAAALRISGDYTLLVTSAVRDLPKGEREALIALALSRTLESNGYFTALQNWVNAPIVVARMIPRLVYLAFAGLLIAAVAAMPILGVGSTAVSILLCAAFPVKMLLLSHVVVRRGFELHVMRSTVLSQDAKAISILRYPPLFRALFATASNNAGKSGSFRFTDLLRLPIWVLPTRDNDESRVLSSKRLQQLDRIDPLGGGACASELNATADADLSRLFSSTLNCAGRSERGASICNFLLSVVMEQTMKPTRGG